MEEATSEATPPSSAVDWDRQFAAGAWSYLHDLNELAHHSVIAGYVAYLGKSATVLDVACGEGNLRRLMPTGISYLGTDWSAVAVENAQRVENDTTCFVVADAETYTPERAFDIIVFNECLYYFKSVTATLGRYATYLAPGGCFIVSMYDAEGNRRIWHEIEAHFTIQDYTRVSNTRRTVWQIALLTPTSNAPLIGKQQN